MNTPNMETETTLQAAAPTEEGKGPKSATRAPRKPRVAPGKGKSGKKTTPAQSRAKNPKPPKPAKSADGVREGSKASKVLDLLKRPDGASLKEIMKATGWQAHSVRGFLSGTVGKKLGLKLTSTKSEDGERSYSIKG